ncbi:MAG: 4Fe-4S binding protein [Anaerolineales bacterium]|nr:4Fe-4S binding protein [Anaerolineales bacterium]
MPLWRQPLDRDRILIRHGIVNIIDDRCKGCGFCIEFCPQNILVISNRTNTKGYHPPEVISGMNCINCGLCALLCPDFAIYIEDGGEHTPENVVPIHRHEVQG